MDVHFEVVIIGAGPAGMASAVYAARAGLKVAMVESGAPGGKLVKTSEIANYPGLETINGTDLAMKMFNQAQSFGVEYLYGDVARIEKNEEFSIFMKDDSVVKCSAVIIASGQNERLLNIPGEKEYTGKGVSYCAVCDGFFFKDQVVTVIGGGNAALEESLYLTQFAKQVNIVIRRDVFRGEVLLQNEVLNNPKINIIKKSIPIEIKGDEKVSSIILENVDTKERFEVETKAVFPYIGLDPNTDFVKDLPILDERKYIITDDDMKTSINGLYAAGDVRVKNLRQVVTAASDGAIAAQSAFHNLKG